MIYIFVILLILYFLFNIQENFTCPKPHEIPRKCTYEFNGTWTTCPNNSRFPGEKCFDCPWKRPHLDYKNNSHCCHRKCYERRPIGEPYYCQSISGNGCIRKYVNDKKYRYCGMHMLYNMPAKVYDNLGECKKSLNKYQNFSKEKCLKSRSTGWCTDYLGNGVCVAGTPLGPTNMIKNNTCFVNQRTDKNSWTYE